MMKNTLLMLMLAAMSTGSMAEWVQVSELDYAVFYIDPATIRKDGNFRKVWNILDLKQRNKDGKMSLRILMEYDCKEERFRELSKTAHPEPMARGPALASDSYTGNWEYIPPSTAAKYTLEIVCSE